MPTNSPAYSATNPGSEGWTTQRAGADGQTQYVPVAFTAADAFFGSGVPSPSLGVDGQYYFRSDTPGTANQRIYVKVAGTWTGIV